MESKKMVELIQEAINQLLEEEEIKTDKLSSTQNFETVDEEENGKAGELRRRQRRLQLLSQDFYDLKFLGNGQLESLEEDSNVPEESKQQVDVEETLPSPSEIVGKINTRSNCDSEDIIKALKNLKRQNLITHCLLSAMIIVTLAWQLTGVSLVLKITSVVCNPFKPLGEIVRRLLEGRAKVHVQEVMKQAEVNVQEAMKQAEVNVQEVMKQASAKQKQVFEPPASISEIEIQELP